jgi:Flp pilus assembly protein TadD
MPHSPVYYAPKSKWFKRFLKATSVGKLAVLLVFLALVIGAGYWAKKNHIYGRWKQNRLIESALKFEKKGDFKNATLAAKQLVKMNPGHIEGTRVMARIAELYKRPEALDWWQRVVVLNPASAPDRFQFVQTAIRVGNLKLAEEALDQVPEDLQTDPQFHKLSGMIAFFSGNLSEAEKHAKALIKLEPDKEEHLLRLALVNIVSTNITHVTQGRSTLQKMSEAGGHKQEAIRSLLSDALRSRDPQRAINFGERLYNEPKAGLDDKLLYLQALLFGKSPAFTNILREVQTSVSTNATDSFLLTRWLNSFKQAGLVLPWVVTLPEKIQNHSLLLMARTESHLALGDWQGLATWLPKTEWKDINYLRESFLAISYFHLKNPEYKELWKKAVAGCEQKADRLLVLGRLGMMWGLVEEAVDLYWALSNDPKHTKSSLAELGKIYRRRNDTHGLYRVSDRKRQLDLKDSRNNNNYALLSLLLNTNVSLAYDLAREAHLKNTTDPDIASTYAFALHHEGRSNRGVKLLEGLPEETLKEPSIAAYYGIMLARSGQKDLARKYLEIAQSSALLPNSSLLPEERRLVQEALATVGKP